jgi:hypothetical protein
MNSEGILTRNRAALLAENASNILPDPGAGDQLFNDKGSRPKERNELNTLANPDIECRPFENDMNGQSRMLTVECSNSQKSNIEHLGRTVDELSTHYTRPVDRSRGLPQPRHVMMSSPPDMSERQSLFSPRNQGDRNYRVHSPRPTRYDLNDHGQYYADIVYDGHHNRRYPFNGPAHSSIPVFYGDSKETWSVWYNRFEDIAFRYKWGNDKKLNELLPRLQGTAGDFVYGQLPTQVRRDFNSLVAELHNRFHKVETSRRFHAKFSNRCQKSGETAEEFAAELKRLYDRAHANRDPRTRKEDLLRRFLDGLLDDQARFHVEFVKDPENIDEAVYEVVNLIDTKKRTKFNPDDNKSRKFSRRLVNEEFGSESENSEDEYEVESVRVARAPNKVFRNKTPHPGNKAINSSSVPTSNSSTIPPWEELKDLVSGISSRLNMVEQTLNQTGPVNPRRNYNPARKPYTCYACNQEGHYIRDCPNKGTFSPAGEKMNSTSDSPEVRSHEQEN